MKYVILHDRIIPIDKIKEIYYHNPSKSILLHIGSSIISFIDEDGEKFNEICEFYKNEKNVFDIKKESK